MQVISEYLETPVKYEYDVLVAGGGIAGIAAALAAARQGAKTVLLEKQFMLGGLATAGLITIYLPLCDGRGTQVSFGIAEELLRLSILHGYETEADYPKPWLENGTPEEKAETRFRVQYNPQLFAIEAERLLKKEGVDILYGTSACAITMKEDKITHVIIENKSGRSGIKVKSVVDATGDADLCVMAGEETALFEQKNILAAWYYHVGKDGYHLRALGVADIPDDEKEKEVEKLSQKRFQGIDGEELSKMVQLSHEALLKDVLSYRKNDSTFFPTTMATIPQVRMTRRIKGCYEMKTSDERKHFSDSIGMISNWKKRGPVYEVPFSALHGEKVKNLITAGRSIAAQDSMWDVTRVIPPCAVTGEAAGTAAAISEDFTRIDILQLQKKLKEKGCRLFYEEL